MDVPTTEVVRTAPKVLLHDHLDGGLRPQTLIELAVESGYDGLPTSDPDELARWMAWQVGQFDLLLCLETFAHTVGVMQTRDALERVAAECAEDLAEDGVVYTEVRFAPALHTTGGLSLDQVVDAVVCGFVEGSISRNIRIGTILTAMREDTGAEEIAELAVRFRDRGVVGFDIAGAEPDNPPSDHLAAFRLLQEANFPFTIHAGEACGPMYIWEAIHACGADRIGHGVRIADDFWFTADGRPHIGTLAAYVRDRQTPLEVCPTSNLHTGAAPSIAEHPIKLLNDLQFKATVNTDNRLMSSTSMTQEMMKLVDDLDFGWADIERLTVNAMESAFIPYDERLEVITKTIRPAYEKVFVLRT